MNNFAIKLALCIMVAFSGFLPGKASARTRLSPDFINFGYLQNNAVLPYIQYDALTHIAAPFVDFNINGDLIGSHVSSFQNRSSHLRLNGSAHRAGTKVIACVRNNNFSETILDTVMQDPVRRNRLKNQVVNLVTSDAYCAGVNFDFEFIWGTSTRDGITAFLQEVRAALPQQYELSVYTHPIFYSSRWNIPAIVDHIDYLLYSSYDWGTGSTPRANGDFDNCIPQIAAYLDAGLPPEKMVITWASYGRRWYNSSGYGVPSVNPPSEPRGTQSQGFYYGLYDTTLRERNGGPFTEQYVRGDEIGWHSYIEDNRQYTTVWETPESIEYKVATALNFPGHNGEHAGVRLGGVGWWSLMWASNYFHPVTGAGNYFDSYDPITGEIVPRPPYYRHIDLLVQEILKEPGQRQFSLESFEAQNDHWRDPNESPDTTGDTDSNSVFSFMGAPVGAGRPADTTFGGRLFFDFEAASGNRVFLRHEVLNNAVETNITDTNAALALVSRNTRISGHYHVAANYSGRTMRLALMDGLRQVEVSDPIPLPSIAGWHTFQWDINDPTQINAYTTNEPALVSGNGILNSKSVGARDISFLGFIIEGGGAGWGTVYFDEITYEERAPEGKNYVINEFRYNQPNGEFIEIAGPPGPFPSDMRLISYNPEDGTEAMAISLAGRSIPASGLFVVGDPGVPGTGVGSGFVPAGWGAAANLPSYAPGSLQLYGISSGFTYDSVVYKSYDGLGQLLRVQTRRVTAEGYAWLGESGPGTTAAGQHYTMGRIPDGADTNINQEDFSFMPPTPGQSNGSPGLMEVLFDFSIAPPSAFQTYRGFTVSLPAPGMPASPGGGSVYRCYDPLGGGVIGVFGDGSLGSERGLDVTGKVYIPAVGDQGQAIAIGIGGSQGSTFFPANPAGSGYENGYWLIYEHRTVNLNDGQPNHPGQFQLVMASHDHQDGEITRALGSNKSLAQLSAGAGSWVDFRLTLNPAAPAGQQLVAQINEVDIYRGSIPADGRTHGAFMVGHRETGGGVAATEGTWIDDLFIGHAAPPAGIQDYELY